MEDLDRQNFNCNDYFQNLIAERRVKELLKRNNELCTEIKTLDSDMQTLVYENYSKFISATDTIRSVKTNVDEMEKEMQDLSNSLEKIQQLNEHIDTSLSSKSTEICRLDNIQRNLKKYKILSDLPSILASSLEQESSNPEIFKKPIKYYNKANKILQQLKEEASLKKIHEESESKIVQIKSIIRRNIQSSANQSDLKMNISHLLHLDEDALTLQSIFISRSDEMLQTLLDTLQAVEAPELEAAEDETYEKILENEKKKVERNVFESENEELNKNFLLTKSSTLWPKGTVFWIVKYVQEQLVARLIDISGGFQELFLNRQECDCQELYGLIERAFGQVFEKFDQRVEQSALSHHHVRNALVTLRSCLSEVARSVEGDYIDKKVEFHLDNSLRAQIDVIFNKRVSALLGVFGSFHSRCEEFHKNFNLVDNDFNEIITGALEALLNEVGDFFTTFKPLVESDGDYSEGSRAAVHKILQDYFVKILDLMWVTCNYQRKDFTYAEQEVNKFSGLREDIEKTLKEFTPVSLYLIGLVEICSEIHSSRIEEIKSKIVEIYEIPANVIKMIWREFDHTVISTQKRCFKEAQSSLIRFYAEFNGRKSSDLMIKNLDGCNWLKFREPRDIRLATEFIIKDFITCSQELVILFGVEKKASNATSLQRRPTTKNRYDQEIERMFESKTTIFGEVEYSRSGVLLSIGRILLKTLSEYIRRETFGKFGYQQIEIDVNFIKYALTEIIGISECAELIGMIEEIIASLNARCIEPESVSATTLETIIEQKRKKLNIGVLDA